MLGLIEKYILPGPKKSPITAQSFCSLAWVMQGSASHVSDGVQFQLGFRAAQLRMLEAHFEKAMSFSA